MPLPQLPLNFKSIPSNHARIPVWQECQSHVRDIFDEAGIDFETIGTSMVKGKNEPHAKPTIVIRVKPNTDKSLWKSTLITVGKMLHSNNALELQVTILEPEAEEQDHAFAIPDDHPLIKIWPERLEDAVLEIVDDIDWLQLNVCKWGRTEQAAKPSILIIVKDKTEAPWDKVCQTIRETCASRGAADLELPWKRVNSSVLLVTTQVPVRAINHFSKKSLWDTLLASSQQEVEQWEDILFLWTRRNHRKRHQSS